MKPNLSQKHRLSPQSSALKKMISKLVIERSIAWTRRQDWCEIGNEGSLTLHAGGTPSMRPSHTNAPQLPRRLDPSTIYLSFRRGPRILTNPVVIPTWTKCLHVANAGLLETEPEPPVIGCGNRCDPDSYRMKDLAFTPRSPPRRPLIPKPSPHLRNEQFSTNDLRFSELI